MKLGKWAIFASLVGSALLGGGWAQAVSTPPPSPQRSVAEGWVGDFNVRNLRAACELQSVGQARGESGFEEPCEMLPTQIPHNCPIHHAGAKPPYRKSEIRSVAEQVGRYVEETNSRGFILINAQVKANGQKGVLGIELSNGSWRVTYFRYGSEILMPAGNVYQGTPGYQKLWVSRWCLTDHPHWQTK